MAEEGQDSKASDDAEKPVGGGNYVVEQGDCISSIAYEHGHLLETILDDPANQELKRTRKNPRVLLPGDRVTIPPIREKDVNADTDMLHTFQLQRVQELFRMRVLDADEKPRKNLQYLLMIEDKTFSGTTNGQGELKHSIPPNAQRGRVILGSGDDTEAIEVRLGHLDPKEAVSGVQARLTNLGFDCGPVDGIIGPRTRRAIKKFQRHAQLQQTGELDDQTLQELESMHRS